MPLVQRFAETIMKRLTYLILGVLLCSLAAAAQPSGKDILRRALDISAAIKDYSADVKVTVDMPDIKVPERSARVYFKRPDKVAIDSKGIVMIPKKALVPGNLGTEVTKDTQVTLAGTTMQNGVPVYFLKVKQTGQKGSDDRLLFWVRGDRYTVERMEAHSANGMQMGVKWEYQLVGGKYWMPRRLVATMKGAAMSQRRPHFDPDQESTAPASNKPGTITVVFNNLKVNTGLRDSLFVEKAQEQRK
jgi:outer membrane lipoprotein-sorting protein